MIMRLESRSGAVAVGWPKESMREIVGCWIFVVDYRESSLTSGERLTTEDTEVHEGMLGLKFSRDDCAGLG